MATYLLTLNIDAQNLQRIRAAGQRIVLARPVNGQTNVVWVAFDPFSSNTVQWQEDYAVYASATMLQRGAQIMVMSQTGMPVPSGERYTLEPSMVFSGPSSGGSPGSYGVQNAVPSNDYPSLTFGLVQPAFVNQQPVQGPVWATTLLSNTITAFTPMQDVLVWLQSGIQGGTIVDPGTNRTTKVQFGGGVSSVTLRYDGNLGVFVPT